MYNSAGTCKMGRRSDSMAVVNSNLLVHGFLNLFIADASIMPLITRGISIFFHLTSRFFT